MPQKYTAIYARQSVEKKDSLSIEGQIELCKKECPGAFIVYEDRGYSGKDTNRPGFEKMMKDISAGKIDRLICYRIDRISRSILDFGSIWENLSAHQVEFISVNEKFDTSTPAGRAMLYIIMVFAQLERETIAERIKDNYYQRVKKGAWPGGKAPYGFRIKDRKKTSNGVCTVEPTDEIEVVKRIFEMYSEPSMSLGRVAKRLSLEGIPCSERKTWDSISIYRVLRNPVCVKADIDIYAYYKRKGLIIYNDVSEFDGDRGGLIVGKRLSGERKYTDMSDHLFALSAHKGVIPSGLFLACQHKLDANRQIKNTGNGKHTWLSGLLGCSDCGYSLRVQKDKGTGNLRLVCSGRTNYHACETRHTESLELAESYVESQIAKRLDMCELKAERAETQSSELYHLKLSLVRTEEKMQNLIRALSDSSELSMKYINSELENLDRHKKDIMRRINDISEKHTPDTSVMIDFPAMPAEHKKLVASILINRISCSPNSFVIDWK